MKKFIAVIAFAGSLFVNAQEKAQSTSSLSPISFGVKAGFNGSTLTRGDGYNYDNNEKIKPGFHAGVFVHIPVTEKFSVQPELLFSQLGSKSDYNYRTTSDNYRMTQHYSYTTTLNYITLPLMVQYNILPQLYVEAGPEFGLLLGGKTKGDLTTIEMTGSTLIVEHNEHVSKSIPMSLLNRFNFGIGIGAGYYFTEKLAATARFTAGITEVYKYNSDDKIRNNAFQIGVAYKFK
ncbi:PorT family protein [Chryseobacterium sp. Tr-659]|uniref:porin family protein n=1 Tax=Chryseobacterium sp. Tr-659 TaxID=2608340 RepID=UPI001423A222|nr:porin family protein [Chryseobacterium sp. Tr-659]NIF05258.1 PorT family protein [Chryseobacterium sp. Tr-659]